MEQNLPTTEFRLEAPWRRAFWNKSDGNLNKSVACYSAALFLPVRSADRRCEFFRAVEEGCSVPPSSAAHLPASRQVKEKGREIDKNENGRRYRLVIGRFVSRSKLSGSREPLA